LKKRKKRPGKEPTLRQAEAGIRAAKARQRQAGLLPNRLSDMRAMKFAAARQEEASRGFLWNNES